MASGSLQCKTLVLRVSIHCEGCKKKVKKVLQSVEGVYKCDVDARSNKVTVAVTGKVGADVLIRKLRKSGKHAEEWPGEQNHHHHHQQQQQPADVLSLGETTSQTTEPDNPIASAEKPESSDPDADAAVTEPGSPKASSLEHKKVAGETAEPAQESAASANSDGDARHGGAKEAASAEQSSGPERKRKQQQPEEEKPADAITTAVPHHAGNMSQSPPPLPLPLQQPAHVVGYSVARPSASGAYYAAAAAPLARLPGTQDCSYDATSSACYHSRPSPFHFSYGHGTPQAGDSYCDLFSDDNANSCSVM